MSARRNVWTSYMLAVAMTLAACDEASDRRETSESHIEGLAACKGIALDEPDDGVQLQMPMSLEPGDEQEQCMLVMLDRDLNLNWSDGRYTNGSHHALLHRTTYRNEIPTVTVTGETIADPTLPHRCSAPSAVWEVRGVIGGGRSLSAVSGGEVHDLAGKGTLPNDVAYRLKKGDVVLLNFHMLNATERKLDSCYKVNLHGIPDAQVAHEAGTLFFYNFAITIPPKGQASARMACPITQDIWLAAGVSHMHARGDGYAAKLLDGSPGDAATKTLRMLYEGTAWDDPVVRHYRGPLKLTRGQWIDYECHYTNPENREVAQGLATTDEMCMFIGAYWPRNEELENCALPDGTSGSNGLLYGWGNGSGADFLDCFWSLEKRVYVGTGDNPARYDTQSCFTQTCREASFGLRPYLTCLGSSQEGCIDECGEDADCTIDCLKVRSCTTERETLRTATCDATL